MQNIHESYLKIKVLGGQWVAEWGVVVIIFLVTLASFGLGRLSALEEAKPLVSIIEAPMDARPSALAPGGLLVAARGGTVYYYPWCTGAGKLTPAGKVWFESEAAARRAGYSSAKGCKGLAPQ